MFFSLCFYLQNLIKIVWLFWSLLALIEVALGFLGERCGCRGQFGRVSVAMDEVMLWRVDLGGI